MDTALRAYILMRDGGCVARYVNNALEASRWPMLQGLPNPGRCRNEFGGDMRPNSLVGLQVDHVHRPAEHAMGMKASDDADHLWCCCAGHHTATRGVSAAAAQWATNQRVREAAPEYIDAANAAAAKNGWPIRPEGV